MTERRSGREVSFDNRVQHSLIHPVDAADLSILGRFSARNHSHLRRVTSVGSGNLDAITGLSRVGASLRGPML